MTKLISNQRYNNEAVVRLDIQFYIENPYYAYTLTYPQLVFRQQYSLNLTNLVLNITF